MSATALWEHFSVNNWAREKGKGKPRSTRITQNRCLVSPASSCNNRISELWLGLLEMGRNVAKVLTTSAPTLRDPLEPKRVVMSPFIFQRYRQLNHPAWGGRKHPHSCVRSGHHTPRRVGVVLYCIAFRRRSARCRLA